MSEGNSKLRNYCEKFCPCRLHKKNVVLIHITICCFALVIWTVVVTMNSPVRPPASNITYVVIDDSKDIRLLNITTTSALTKARAAAKAAAVAAAATTPKPMRRASFLRDIVHPVTQETLCKCLCGRTSYEEVVAALQFKVAELAALAAAAAAATTTTTPPPTTTPSDWPSGKTAENTGT